MKSTLYRQIRKSRIHYNESGFFQEKEERRDKAIYPLHIPCQKNKYCNTNHIKIVNSWKRQKESLTFYTSLKSQIYFPLLSSTYLGPLLKPTINTNK